MKNMTLTAVAKAINGKAYNIEGAENIDPKGVVIDSRQVEKDFIFIAVKGERVDGHSFIDDVYSKGAVAVISEKELKDEKRPYILVDSTLSALKSLAQYYRNTLDIKLIGITGSVGKTSTKEFIASVLSEKYNVLKTEGNFNNEIGLPLTILKIREEHQIAVIEMGISHFGDMRPLGIIAKPDICVITNIGDCHLENLIDREGVLKEKSSMFDYANNNASYVLNGDDDMLITLQDVNGKQPVFVSTKDKNVAIHLLEILNSHIDGTDCNINVCGNNLSLHIPLPGKHMILNALTACAVGNLCNVSLEQMKAGIEKIEPVSGRVNVIREKGYTIIDDCYNANPVSMKASIDVLSYAEGRKVAVLGDMYELGQDEVLLHGSVGEHISKYNIDVLITIGEISKNIGLYAEKSGFKGQIIHCDNIDSFVNVYSAYINKGDTVLVKASHGMHLEKVINLLTNK